MLKFLLIGMGWVGGGVARGKIVFLGVPTSNISSSHPANLHQPTHLTVFLYTGILTLKASKSVFKIDKLGDKCVFT
jgi:hypothetical protein